METILTFLAGLFMCSTGLLLITSNMREKKLRKNLREAHERIYEVERKSIVDSINAKPLPDLLKDDEYITQSSKEPDKD